MSKNVKGRRAYDATNRRADALARRAAVLVAARELFLVTGFAATTMAAVAERAEVSPETVYKNFGNKPGLVRALHDEAMRGDAAATPYSRSEELRGLLDPYEIAHGWSRLSAEVAPRVSPLLLLLRDAAAVQPELGELLAELDQVRHQRMSENARFLDDAGHLRHSVDRQAAADLLWAATSPELYELLVLRREWSLDQYADHIFRTISSLLAPRDARRGGAHDGSPVPDAL